MHRFCNYCLAGSRTAEMGRIMARVSSKRLIQGAAFGAAVSLLAALPWGLMVGLSNDSDTAGNDYMVFRALAIPALLKGSTAGVLITLGWCCWRRDHVEIKPED